MVKRVFRGEGTGRGAEEIAAFSAISGRRSGTRTGCVEAISKLLSRRENETGWISPQIALSGSY
jgi:hypothetical protein